MRYLKDETLCRSSLSFLCVFLSLVSITVLLQYGNNNNSMSSSSYISKIIQTAAAISTHATTISSDFHFISYDSTTAATITGVKLPGIIPSTNNNNNSASTPTPTPAPTIPTFPPASTSAPP